MKIESELIVPDSPNVRRIVIELPEDRALALSRVLNQYIDWRSTEAENELIELHAALGEDFGESAPRGF